jgi:hypothetical protein
MNFEQIPYNLPFEKPIEKLPDSSIKNKDEDFEWTPEKEELFLDSLDISPDKRLELRRSLERMRNLEMPWTYCLQELEKFPSELLTSDYVKNIAKESFYKRVTAFDSVYNLGDWVETMKTFGIEKDFFLQKDFDEYRKERWLDSRLKGGEKIDDPDRFRRGWTGTISEIDLKILEERKLTDQFEFGDFEEIGLKYDSPEVKKAAVEGMVNRSFNYSIVNDRRETAEILLEYKKLFNISEDEFEKNFIANLKSEWFSNYTKEYEKLRQLYPFVDSFFNSEEGREFEQVKITEEMIRGGDPKELMNFFSLTTDDFNQEEIKEKRKMFLARSLEDSLEKDTQNTYFQIRYAQKVFSHEDWQNFFNEHENSSGLIMGLAQQLTFSWQLDESLSVYKEIGLSKEKINEVSVQAIALLSGSENSVEKVVQDIKKLQAKINLSEDQLNEGLTLGIINRINREGDRSRIEELKKEFHLEVMKNSPEIQKSIKEVYIDKVQKADTYNLELLNQYFDIEWKEGERLVRREAVKHALRDHYRLGGFHSTGAVKKFIDTYYPEVHKQYWLLDNEVKESVEMHLINLPFSSRSIHTNNDYVDEMIAYFNLSKEKIINAITAKIAEGYFISNPIEKNNFHRFFPEIDVERENKKCLETKGPAFIKEGFERKNWERLLEVEDFENTEAKKVLDEMLDSQEKILIDTTKSSESRLYAFEALSHLPGTSENSILVRNVSKLISNPLLKKESPWSLFQRLYSYTPEERKAFFRIIELPSQQMTDFNDDQWDLGILSYVDVVEEENQIKLSADDKGKILKLFDGPYKDTALKGIHDEWKSFLNNEEREKFLPPQLFLIGKMVDDVGGAGNLKHIESLSNLIYQVDTILENPQIPERTKIEIKTLLANQELRISSEKWSQDDRSEFYNLSRDIIEAAPSLYTSFGPVLKELSPKEMKIFLQEIFPMYQAELITIQEISGNDRNVTYKPRDLVVVRQAIKNLVKDLENNPENKILVLTAEKNRFTEVIKNSFKNRFGILKVPEEFNKQNIRSVQNSIRYLGNITGRNKTTEALIALYLGLQLNDEWDKFRQGEDIKPEEYLEEAQLESIKSILEEKIKSHTLPLDVADIPPDMQNRFQEILQEDTSSNMMGSIQTIDVKLGNITRNLQELADPDIYNLEEKEIMNLFLEEGKLVGSVLAKTYSEVSGKKVVVSEKERAVQNRLAGIFNITNWTTDQVKQIQDKIQPFSLIVSMLNKTNEEKVDDRIEELQKSLVPSGHIIEIFNRLGEEFRQESGAFALSKDLAYLESLIVKDEKKLSNEDKKIIDNYLNSIKEKMQDLETLFDKVKEYFLKIKKSSHVSNHELLKNRLKDIQTIFDSTDSNEMIVSHMTKDLNLIIENMRQCLGCLRKEANNDTNLAFADYNKFFMINQSGKDKGSISDEIIFFVPVKFEGKEEMSFVLDRVYGSKSPDILISNILTVYKKYKTIKKEIPRAKISISISKEAMASVGFNNELLIKRMKELSPEIQSAEYTDINSNIPESAFSDNYVEFGNKDARESGERVFSGIVLH